MEIPEGGGPIGIDPLDSAKREVKEETGLVAKEWSKIVELHNSNSVTDEYAKIYLARKLEQHTPAPEETEQLALKKIHFEEVYKMVEEGTITDAISVVAVLKVKLMLTDRTDFIKNSSLNNSALIIGRHPIIEAIEAGRAIDKIFFQNNVSGDSIGRIRKLAKDKNIPIQQVPLEKLYSFTRGNHQGCIAIAALVQYLDLQQVIDHVVGNGETPFF